MSEHPNFTRTRWENITGTIGFLFLLVGGIGIYFRSHGLFTQIVTGIGIVLCGIAHFFLSPRGSSMKTQFVDIAEGGRLAELKDEPKGPFSPHTNGEVQRNTLLIFLPPGILFLYGAVWAHQTLWYWLLGIPGVGLTMGAFWPLIKRGMGQRLRQSRPPSSAPPAT